MKTRAGYARKDLISRVALWPLLVELHEHSTCEVDRVVYRRLPRVCETAAGWDVGVRFPPSRGRVVRPRSAVHASPSVSPSGSSVAFEPTEDP